MACELFGFNSDELIGLQLNDLVTLKKNEQSTLLESHLEATGEIVEVAGKVVKKQILLQIRMTHIIKDCFVETVMKCVKKKCCLIHIYVQFLE